MIDDSYKNKNLYLVLWPKAPIGADWCIIYFLSSGTNVPYLSNKNNLDRKLPQVKLFQFPSYSLLSVSIEVFSVYFGKLKQLLCSPRAGISQSSRFIIIILSTEGEKKCRAVLYHKHDLDTTEATGILAVKRLKTLQFSEIKHVYSACARNIYSYKPK